MISPSDLEYGFRVLLAAGCGGLIGLERQYRSRTAGLRTQALVAVGAASFVLFGVQAGLSAAPLQIAAYVVSGVGFLGGGVILRQGFSVQGLNTAATLWCSAAVGCQAAAGHLVPALVTTTIVLVVHLVLRPVARVIDRIPAARAEQLGAYRLQLRVAQADEAAVREHFSDLLDQPDTLVQGMTRTAGPTGDAVELEVELLIEGNAHARLDALMTDLNRRPGVMHLAWTSDTEANSHDGGFSVRRLRVPRFRRQVH